MATVLSGPPADNTSVRRDTGQIRNYERPSHQRKPEPGKKKSAEEHARDQTKQMKALFEWAEKVLKDMGLLDALRDVKTREELDALKLDEGDLTLIMAIRDALHPGAGKSRKKHFERLTELQLKGILRNRLNMKRNDKKQKLAAN